MAALSVHRDSKGDRIRLRFPSQARFITSKARIFQECLNYKLMRVINQQP